MKTYGTAVFSAVALAASVQAQVPEEHDVLQPIDLALTHYIELAQVVASVIDNDPCDLDPEGCTSTSGSDDDNEVVGDPCDIDPEGCDPPTVCKDFDSDCD